MADRMLFIGWGTPVRGREERGLEVFNEAIGLYGRMQQEGRIEKFDVVLLGPNPDLAGYIELHGSAEQLSALRESEDFRRTLADASLIVEDCARSTATPTRGSHGRWRSTRKASRGFRRPPDARPGPIGALPRVARRRGLAALTSRCERVDTCGMGRPPGSPRSGIAAHIESVSSRAELGYRRLVSAMLRGCWPGGTGDRTESVAREWVRRWGPRRAGPLPPACRCAVGHCGVCN